MNTDKIITAVATMVNTPELIMDVYQKGDEYYFSFKGHTFSINKYIGDEVDEGYFRLYVYPEWTAGTGALAEAYEQVFDPDDMPKHVLYTSRDLGTHGESVLGGLYKTLESKHFGIDEIWDSIINGF